MEKRTRISRRAAVNLMAGAIGAGLLPNEAQAASFDLLPGDLRVEWLTDPVGIDTLKPRFRWLVKATPAAGEARPASFRVIVSTTPEKLTARQGDVWDSGVRKGSILSVQPDHPLPLRSHTAYYWGVVAGETHLSQHARFVTGILKASEWRADWIAAGPEPTPIPPHPRGQSKIVSDPAQTTLPLLRRAFRLDQPPVAAFVSVSGLGHFELTVNGRPATDSVLNPGWTNYDRTALYVTYDIASALRAGVNVLGVRLGNGMYNVEKIPGRKSKFVDSFGRPKLLLQLSLHFADGSVGHVVSDSSWQVREGPILFSSIFGGEDVDARREPPGWDLTVTDLNGWRPVTVIGAQPGRLKASAIPPVRMDRRFDTVAITEPRPGIFVYDLGENFAGRPEMVVRGPAGKTVRLTPCEVLGEDGLAWQKSFNAGPPDRWVLYNYTLAGMGDERFIPRFTYHGFRYLQVEGAIPVGRNAVEGTPEIVSLSGQFLHADLPRTGTFDCSDPLLVRTHHLIERAVLSNAFSVLTDCPHREKLGWLEQTHLNAATIFYNRDASTLYEKIGADMADSQQPDGMVPGIAPEYVAFLTEDGKDQDARNSPEWGGAMALGPWAAYRTYGDAQILADGYPAMQRYAAYLAARASGHIVDFGLGDWYDVGPGKLGASQLTSRALSGTATYFQVMDTIARIARVLDRPAGEIGAAEVTARQIREAFNARFLDPATGVYDRGSQTANAMPLALGMVPPAQKSKTLDALVRAVRQSGNGVTAGDVGFHYVIRALTEQGRDDVIFDMLSITERPSYGYQLAHGATALAESWNADPTKSLNHFMLGHAEGWLFGGLCGIRIDFAAGPDRIITIDPRPVGTVRFATATCRSVFGDIKSEWRREDGLLRLDVVIPPGATARVIVPSTDPGRVHEGGKPVRYPSRQMRTVNTGLEIVLASGCYRFTAPFKT